MVSLDPALSAKKISVSPAWKLFLTPDFVLNANPQKRTSLLEDNKTRNFLLPTVIIFLVMIIDQSTKLMAVAYLAENPPVKVLGDFFMLSLVYNYGGALGTSFGPSIYYLISSLFIFLFVLYYLYKNLDKKHLAMPLAFISGGAIGNIIDRLRIGKVIDFIDIDFVDINLFGYQLERWWTFNIADAAISCSIVYLLYHMIKHGEARPEISDNANKVIG